MSEAERKCKNCGASIAPHERTCPSCGRLAIDRRTSRLGAESERALTAEESRARLTDTGVSPPPTDARPASAGDPGPSENGAKPDSYYAVAPIAARTCPDCGKSFTGNECKNCGYKPPRGKGGCCSCAVVLGLISWLMTLVFVL
ncbi:MAG: hypothetical protein ACXADC_10900 [Candidatus Thorarchaeota archaeon]